jgi:hypothetical protein
VTYKSSDGTERGGIGVMAFAGFQLGHKPAQDVSGPPVWVTHHTIVALSGGGSANVLELAFLHGRHASEAASGRVRMFGAGARDHTNTHCRLGGLFLRGRRMLRGLGKASGRDARFVHVECTRIHRLVAALAGARGLLFSCSFGFWPAGSGATAA